MIEEVIEINKNLVELGLQEYTLDLTELSPDIVQTCLDNINVYELEENKFTLDPNDADHRYVKINYDGELLLWTTNGWTVTNLYI